MIHSISEDDKGTSWAIRDTASFASVYPHSETTNGKSLHHNKENKKHPHDMVGTKSGSQQREILNTLL